MSGHVHQLFAADRDLDAAWDRYVALIEDLERAPELRKDRDHIDRQLAAFNEYRRLFELKLQRESQS